MKSRTLNRLWLGALLAGGIAFTANAEPVVGVAAMQAGSIVNTAFAKLSWTQLQLPYHGQVDPSLSADQLSGNETGQFAAFAIPANRGDLTIHFESDVRKNQLYAPNILVLNGQMVAERFYPASLWQYKPASFLSPDRLEGEIRLVPSPGQQFLYVLFYSERKDLNQTTTLVAPAKAFAAGTRHAVPDIPDPIARHVSDGPLKLRITSQLNEQIGSTVVGQPAPSIAAAVPPSAGTQAYFKQAIETAVAQGDINQAMQLKNEAQRVGIDSAQQIFVQAVKANLKNH
ncbi:MalM family protein [Celerinatantimonas sp. YJH-8]|uniref:MalM family protein n=1 Tax=Celerinatantimonas sp. YJH-8 TaxID=3228714 RepID=UPI0038C9861C